jgi:hypothetical protein
MRKRSIELVGRLGVILCWCLGGSAAALAQSVCDPSKPVEQIPWDRYHERDGYRCEGVYGQQPVSGDIIGEIASFTLGRPHYDLDSTPLTLAWPSAVEGPVHLRAVALREDLLYQMDAEPPAGASSLEWPSDVLAYRKIEPADLGVRAWVVETLLGRPRPLHVPLSVGQGEPAPEPEELAPGSDRYWLVIVPGAPLSTLEVAIDRLGPAEAASDTPPGGTADKLREITPYLSLNRSYYAAKRAVRFALPVLAEPGTYRLRLHAERDSDGEPDSESFWFAHVVP